MLFAATRRSFVHMSLQILNISFRFICMFNTNCYINIFYFSYVLANRSVSMYHNVTSNVYVITTAQCMFLVVSLNKLIGAIFNDLLDFFCSGIQFNLLLSPYPCFISLLYLDLYVLGDDALIS